MTAKAEIDKFFYDVQNSLSDTQKFGRHQFFIAGECLRLFESLDEHEKGYTEPYKEPFLTAFFYFIETARFENAEKIFRIGLRGITLRQLFVNFFKRFDKVNKNEKDFAERIYLDRLMVFLFQVGKQKEIHEAIKEIKSSKKKNISSSQVDLLKWSWPLIINRFFAACKENKIVEMIDEVMWLMTDIDPEKIAEIKNPIIGVKFRRWLLKRQMMAFYAVIIKELRNPAFKNSEGYDEILDSFKQLTGGIVQNYSALQCLTTIKNIHNTRVLFEKSQQEKFKPVFIDDIKENLFAQITQIAENKRYSDIGDFFKEIFGLKLFPSFPGKVEDYFNDHKDRLLSLDNESWIRELKGIENWGDNLNEPDIESKEDTPPYPMAGIKDFLEESITDRFWATCQQVFTEERLKILFVSLDNKYSSEASYFFDSPSVHYDGHGRVDTELVICKRWGSSGGLLERDKYLHDNFGGGHFLYHHGIGIAIDPGPDFLTSLTRNSTFDLMDINGVVVSHPHHDHKAEFARIALGLREYNLAAGYKKLYHLFPDQDDQDLIHPSKIREDFCIDLLHSKNREIYNGSSVYYIPDTNFGKKDGIRIQTIKVKHMIYTDRNYRSLAKQRKRLLEAFDALPEDDEKRIRMGKDIKVIEAKMENIRRQYLKSSGMSLDNRGSRLWSYSLLISPLRGGRPLTNILFTADVEYQDNLYDELTAEHFKFKPQLIVMNMTSARLKDVIAIKPVSHCKVPSPAPKKNHLGFSGCMGVLDRLGWGGHNEQPKLAIISDYFEAQSMLDSRLLINEAFRRELPAQKGFPPKILGAEAGLRIRWPNPFQLEVFCGSSCNIENLGFVNPWSNRLQQSKSNPHSKKQSIWNFCESCNKIKEKVEICHNLC